MQHTPPKEAVPVTLWSIICPEYDPTTQGTLPGLSHPVAYPDDLVVKTIVFLSADGKNYHELNHNPGGVVPLQHYQPPTPTPPIPKNSVVVIWGRVGAFRAKQYEDLHHRIIYQAPLLADVKDDDNGQLKQFPKNNMLLWDHFAEAQQYFFHHHPPCSAGPYQIERDEHSSKHYSYVTSYNLLNRTMQYVLGFIPGDLSELGKTTTLNTDCITVAVLDKSFFTNTQAQQHQQQCQGTQLPPNNVTHIPYNRTSLCAPLRTGGLYLFATNPFDQYISHVEVLAPEVLKSLLKPQQQQQPIPTVWTPGADKTFMARLLDQLPPSQLLFKGRLMDLCHHHYQLIDMGKQQQSQQLQQLQKPQRRKTNAKNSGVIPQITQIAVNPHDYIELLAEFNQ